MKKDITAEEVRELLSYDPVTGIFTRRTGPRAGMQAGHFRKTGYCSVSIYKRYYEAHRLAWFYMTGRWPIRIDHVDLNPSNNAFKNLREALPWQNNANIGPKRDGKKGVTVLKNGKFQAQIKLGGRSFYLGLFGTEEEANAAYAGAARVLFGNFARAA